MTKEKLECLKKNCDTAEDIVEDILCVLAFPILLIALLVAGLYEFYIKSKRRKQAKEVEDKRTKFPEKTDVMSFSKDCAPVLPYSSVAYVATEPDSQIENFFQTDKEWLAKWSEWYGLDLVEVDMEEVRKALTNPNCFALLQHGLLWRARSSTEYDCYYYFELNPDTAEQLQKQLVNVAHDILKKVAEGGC